MFKKILACMILMAIYNIANSDQLSDKLVKLNDSNVPQTDDFWQRLRTGFRLDRDETSLVRYYEKRYTQNPKSFQRIMTNARPYIYYVLLETERNGFPSEIALLPIVESSYNPFAVSPAGISTGMWQFVGMTGKRFNLVQTSQIDERQDIVKSTKAAIQYLGYLNDMFGRWDLTLAAYNWGEGRIYGIVQTAQRNGDSLAYADLPFRDATKSYVPKLVALANIIDNPSKFGVKLDSMPNQPYFAIVSSGNNLNTQKFNNLADINANKFKELNPQFKVSNYSFAINQKLLLPVDKQNIYAVNAGFASIPILAIKPIESDSVMYLANNIESNDSKVIASAVKISAEKSSIVVKPMEANKINSLTIASNSIKPLNKPEVNDLIDEIKLNNNHVTTQKYIEPKENISPIKDISTSKDKIILSSKEPTPSTPKAKIVHYKVKHGDTLYSISKKFNVDVDNIRRDNKLAGNDIKLNQILQIK